MGEVRPVILHLQDGTTIEYESMAVLAESLGVHVNELRECVKTGLYLDHSWVRVKITYLDGGMPRSRRQDGIVPFKEQNKDKKAFQTNTRRIKAVNPLGEEISFDSIAMAKEKTGITSYMIKKSLNEGITVGDGWVFEDRDKNYKPRSTTKIVNNKPVIAILPNGEKREYQSIRKCADDFGISVATIRNRIVAKKPTKQGITFERV